MKVLSLTTEKLVGAECQEGGFFKCRFIATMSSSFCCMAMYIVPKES